MGRGGPFSGGLGAGSGFAALTGAHNAADQGGFIADHFNVHLLFTLVRRAVHQGTLGF
ncbi:hypothetical protein CHEID_01910 [Corynebacterium heidelbergense]|nr:hypothetical protein CHEID_01910 [Corynebacterium heidelbergense]